MVRTTREQREALLRIWRRDANALSYFQFRRTVQPTIGCDGAVVVPWCGMWLCIETDGYAHS